MYFDPTKLYLKHNNTAKAFQNKRNNLQMTSVLIQTEIVNKYRTVGISQSMLLTKLRQYSTGSTWNCEFKKITTTK